MSGFNIKLSLYVDFTCFKENMKLTLLIAHKTKNFDFFYYDQQMHNYVTNYHTNTRVGTLIVTTIYLQLIQNRYIFQSFIVLQCSHQHCVQPVASDVEVVGYL